jgi:hypothetical protein
MDNMKHLIIASVASLVLTLACQQKASAWGFQIGGCIGISISFDCSCCCTCCPSPYGGGGYGGYAYSAPAYSAPYSYYAAGYAPNAGSAVAYQLPAAQPQTGTLVAQPMGYSYAYGGYAYYGAPGYWYGR